MSETNIYHAFKEEKTKRTDTLEKAKPPFKRLQEYACIIVFALYATIISVQALQDLQQTSATLLSKCIFLIGSSVLGIFGADYISGIVHWFCDTWGTIDWPIVCFFVAQIYIFQIGRSFIKNFRQHHVDPLGITRHDWIDTKYLKIQLNY